MHARRSTRYPILPAIPDALSPAQHHRVRRAHHKYQYTQYQREEAAARESVRCICEMDPALRPDPVTLTPGVSGDRRRDPPRLSEPLQQVYSLLLGMFDVAQRNATNWLLYVARQTGEDLSEVPGLGMLAMIAAHRLPLRRGDVVDLITQLHASGVSHPRAPKQPEKRAVYMDAAGAHMQPDCPHSDLWRTTRPMSSVLRHHARTDRWPEDLRPFGGTATAPVKRKRRRKAA